MTSLSIARAAASRRALLAFGTCALLAAAATLQPAGAQDRSYRDQLEACRSGATYQTRDACLAEARAARAAQRSGRLETYGGFAANALARCNAYREQEDVLACRARVMGLGEVTGSVAGGGLLREFEYQVPASAAQADSASAASPGMTGQSERAMGAGAAPRSEQMPQSRLAPDHPAARMARPPEPVEPLKPILPTTPAFPMYEK